VRSRGAYVVAPLFGTRLSGALRLVVAASRTPRLGAAPACAPGVARAGTTATAAPTGTPGIAAPAGPAGVATPAAPTAATTAATATASHQSSVVVVSSASAS